MKKFAMLALLLSVGCGSFQIQKTPDAKVYPVEGVKKEQLMAKAHQWIAENFGKAKEVIQYKSVPEGKMICKGINRVTLSTDIVSRKYFFTWVMEFKNDKILMEYKNIVPLNEGNVIGAEYNGFTKNQIDKQMDAMMKDMIGYIKKGSKPANW